MTDNKILYQYDARTINEMEDLETKELVEALANALGVETNRTSKVVIRELTIEVHALKWDKNKHFIHDFETRDASREVIVAQRSGEPVLRVGAFVRTGNGRYGITTEHQPDEHGLDGWGVDTGEPDGVVWWHMADDLEVIK